MMMQKDQVELETWWNTAFDRLRTTGQYNDICDRLKTAHGKIIYFTVYLGGGKGSSSK